MAALDQVVDWATTKLVGWQSDAVRRLLTQVDLSDQDKAELLSLLKAKHGLLAAGTAVPTAKPLDPTAISGAAQGAEKLSLIEIKDLKNINAIPDASYVPFGHEGISVIYGENGTGKSGYARVMKRACNARDTKETIHPNVFGAAATDPASATFRIKVNEAEQALSWAEGSVIEVLSRVMFFDARCARVIVDEDNDVTYMPYGTDVFERLIALLKDLRARLTAEKPNTAALSYADVGPMTAANSFLAALNSSTPIGDVDQAMTWSAQEKDRLQAINQKLIEAEAPDRSQKIDRLRRLAKSAKGLATAAASIQGTLDDAAVRKLTEKIEASKAAEEVLSATGAAKKEMPLPGFGEKAWKDLYLAAREYSMKAAYPAVKFPNTGPDSLCVFCMQPLGDDAKERLKHFDEAIEHAAQKNADKAAADLTTQLAPVKSVSVAAFQDSQEIIAEIASRKPALKAELDAFSTSATQRVAAMVAAGNERKSTLDAFAVKDFETPLGDLAAIMEKEAADHEAGLTPEAVRDLRTERTELLAKENLCSRRQDVDAFLERLRVAGKFDQAITDTDFQSISTAGKKIGSGAVTPELRAALKTELSKLGAAYLPLDLKAIGTEGELLHKLTLSKGKLPRKAALADILSEGEQRVVAIGGFLAELSLSGQPGPIVMDDPVSSLDHVYREKIAERLVLEAKTRQVIAFTHDIAFLMLIEDFAGKHQSPFAPQTIRRKGDTPGFSAKGAPWHAMKVSDRLLMIRTKLTTFQGLHESDKEEYNEKAATLYGRLRETWEAIVEERLLNSVITRHGAAVQTKSLRGVAVLTPDYRRVSLSMGKCSEWMIGHDKSKGLDQNRPAPLEIMADIDEAQTFQKEVGQRRAALEAERDAALQAPRPTVG